MRQFSSDWIRNSQDFFTVLYSTPRTQIASMVLAPGQTSGEFGSDHPQADQILIVIEGQVDARVGEQMVTLGVGDSILVEAGESHQIIGAGQSPAKTLNIYGPPAYPEDD